MGQEHEEELEKEKRRKGLVAIRNILFDEGPCQKWSKPQMGYVTKIYTKIAGHAKNFKNLKNLIMKFAYF